MPCNMHTFREYNPALSPLDEERRYNLQQARSTKLPPLHVPDLSLDLFLGAVRAESKGQRDFVPIPLDLIDTPGSKASGRKTGRSARARSTPYDHVETVLNSRPLGFLLILSRTPKLHRTVLVQFFLSFPEFPFSPRPTGGEVSHIPCAKDRGRRVLDARDGLVRPVPVRMMLMRLRLCGGSSAVQGLMLVIPIHPGRLCGIPLFPLARLDRAGR